MKLLITATATLLLPMAAAFAQSSATPDQSAQPAQPAQDQQQGTSFESLDTNKDGRISKSEAAASASVSAQFSKYDQNGDGYIERSEVNSANHSQAPEQGQP
jgi:Ca2+-binding EF-hand superfamily protein